MIRNKRYKNINGKNVRVYNNPTYDDAIVYITDDNRAVYDYKRMINIIYKDGHLSKHEIGKIIQKAYKKSYRDYDAPMLINYKDK